jgi:hypothetical protein
VAHAAYGGEGDVVLHGDFLQFGSENARRVALRAADESVEGVDEEADPGFVAGGEVVRVGRAVVDGIGEEREREHVGWAIATDVPTPTVVIPTAICARRPARTAI